MYFIYVAVWYAVFAKPNEKSYLQARKHSLDVMNHYVTAPNLTMYSAMRPAINLLFVGGNHTIIFIQQIEGASNKQ